MPRVPVPVSSKLALKRFSIRESQEEAGNSMHLGPVSICAHDFLRVHTWTQNPESLPSFLALTESGNQRRHANR